jgi:hemoglobin-like flavoprotein
MNAEQIAMVQSTWAKVLPIKDTAASLFYGKLFELDPELRPMFKASLEEQGAKLMTMIDAAVGGLGDLGALVPAVQDLGRRHANYGVVDEHYDTVAVALLWTLEKGLGEDFTPPVKQAWTETYLTLAGVMKGAAAKMAA